MRQIDRLVVREIVGPWVFGVGMFASLLVAATYLGRLAGFIVDGAPLSMVGELVLLYLPSMLVKTFSMAMLLAALLAFGRLSSDSEIVALQAGGANIGRIVASVAAFSLAVAVITFFFDELVVPSATQRSVDLQNQIAQRKDLSIRQPEAQTVIEHGKLKLAIVAQNARPGTRTLEQVAVVGYDDQGVPTQVMTARQVQYAGPNEWIIPYGAHITSLKDPRQDTDIQGEMWPSSVPLLHSSFADLIKARDDDFDSVDMKELRERIQSHRSLQDRTPAQIANYEYGYWNKISVPFAAIVFGTLGAVLGIRNHRTGTAAGFALAVAIIFGYVTLANFMSVWAMGGTIPAWVASFGPLVVGLVSAGFMMWRRNS